MTDIKDFILQLEDTTLSLEEQQAALAMIEQTLIENKQIQEKTLEENSNLIVDAVKQVEAKLNSKFESLKTDSTLKGPKGDKGTNGKDGRNGVDGLNGRNGTNGKDGKDGKDGEDGVDGRYVTDVEVDIDDTLLVTLSDGTQIKTTKTIVGPEGPRGIPGPAGHHGVGVASGGSPGQVLAKSSTNDYDTYWTSTPGIDLASPDAIGDVTPNTGAFTSLTSQSGALNGTIGATTPSTGNFTTITGQTEVLKGTGQNLQLYSQTFTNTGTWAVQNGTVFSANTTTAPDSTLTASTFSESLTTTNQAALDNTSPIAVGIAYTYSIYVKANTATVVQLVGRSGTFGANIWANFNLSTGAVGSVGTSVTATSITSVGSGWYRCSMTGVAVTAGTGSFGIALTNNNASATRYPSYLGTGQTLYVWGAQLELGSTLNTYIPTTTTAVYGTPSLSFSGVAGIGLESNGALYVSPAGTGALQAQATTSTATGGNARGAYAVDWQTARSAASQVASGTYATIGGGIQNTVAGFGATIAGGGTNSASVVYGAIGGGTSNNAGSYAFMGGGQSNSGLGYYNFIGGGFTNTGTASAAVTTQAAATNGVTNGSASVTLSASNAAIKVGQLITGTGIVSFTYVAAISGTSLTLSQNANATGTPTLSFFTPHGVVVGGGNNQATGSYSFIGGGGDAGTTTRRNTASGDWSFVGGGANNLASGIGAVVAGGGLNSTAGATGNTATGTGSAVVGGNGNNATNIYTFVGSGQTNNATQQYATISGGYSNTANAGFSTIVGGSWGTTRSIVGNLVFPACFQPLATAQGVSQSALLVLARQTTDATATVLTSDSSAAGTFNQVILPNNSAYLFKATVIAGVTGAGNTSGWKLEGVIKRGANAAATSIVGTVTTTLLAQDVGAATWAVTATADTTNGGLKITVTGQAATTIRWVCKVETTECTY